jgi:hypothetical protein
MRQRTLGIIAGALLLGGAALGAGTAIVAYRTAATSPSAATAQGSPIHRQPFGRGRIGPGPGPGFQRPGGGPEARPGGFGGV